MQCGENAVPVEDEHLLRHPVTMQFCAENMQDNPCRLCDTQACNWFDIDQAQIVGCLLTIAHMPYSQTADEH